MVCSVVSFFIGYEWTKPVDNNANAVLAYQHYYEVASEALAEITMSDAAKKELKLAESEIDSVKCGQVLTWPRIVDQRDQLSDAIRCYSDEHPESNIAEYVMEFSGKSMEDLGLWCFSY